MPTNISAVDLYNCIENKEDYPKKKLKEGTKFRIIGLDWDNPYTWNFIEVECTIGKKTIKGWLPTAGMDNLTCLIPFFPDVRKEYVENIKNREVKLGMNRTELFLALALYQEKPNNNKIETWKYTDLKGIPHEIDIYNDIVVYHSMILKNENFGYAYYPTINYSLESVELNSQKIENSQIENNTGSLYKYEFMDDNLNITFDIKKKSINFILKNNVDSSIKLLWDEMVFVNSMSTAKRLIHSNIKFNEKDNEQPNTIVPKGAIISDMLIPSENIHYNSQRSKWEIDRIFNSPQRGNYDYNSYTKYTKGKIIKIVFPIIINEERIEYTFNFRLKDVYFEEESIWTNKYIEHI